MVEEDLIPSKIMTQKAFENAIALDMALGGSSNTALHIPAIANEFSDKGVDVTLSLFDEISQKVPHIALLSPAGVDTILDLHNAGGVQAVLKDIEPKINKDCLTCLGTTVGENIKDVVVKNEEVIHPMDNPVHGVGGLAILKEILLLMDLL